MIENFIVVTESMMYKEISDGISKDVALTLLNNIELSDSKLDNLKIMELDVIFLDAAETADISGSDGFQLFNTLPDNSTINKIILTSSEKIDYVQMQNDETEY